MKRKKITVLCMLMGMMIFSLAACGIKDVKESETIETSFEQTAAEQSVETLAEETVKETKEENVSSVYDTATAGSSQSEAILIPLGEKITGTIDDYEEDWYAFTTGDNPKDSYNITVINTTVNSPILYVELHSDTEVFAQKLADYRGQATTISMDGSWYGKLEANTTYYVRITTYGKGGTDYALVVKDPNSKTTSYKTVGDIIESRGADQNQEVYAGSNQSEATLIPFDVKVSGKIFEGRNAWFAFKTEKDIVGMPYYIKYEDSTGTTSIVEIHICDEYGNGTKLGWYEQNSEGSFTLIEENLEPDTIYYIWIEGYETKEYSLVIEAPEKEEPLKVEEQLVFEVPFEINETQVQFVINKAEFIDEEKAKEKLKPVAEAILEHPENQILIAGTTATDGTQESCVDLSNRRAQAVKNLLMETYAVPEHQLQIIGLGYEKDPFERGKDRDANGNFVESEGKKNRRVVILDMNDPIAQEILANNL